MSDEVLIFSCGHSYQRSHVEGIIVAYEGLFYNTGHLYLGVLVDFWFGACEVRYFGGLAKKGFDNMGVG